MVDECDLKSALLIGKLSLIDDVQSLRGNCLEVLVRMMSAEVERPRS